MLRIAEYFFIYDIWKKLGFLKSFLKSFLEILEDLERRGFGEALEMLWRGSGDARRGSGQALGR